MKRIAVAELRAELRAILSAVANGAAVEVLRYGEPVALIIPASWDTISADAAEGGVLAKVVAVRRTACDLASDLETLERALRAEERSHGNSDTA